MTEKTDSKLDGAYRGRRISWAEFYKLFPDRRPVNDNKEGQQDAA